MVILLTLMPQAAWAINSTWTGTTNSNWNDAGNWSVLGIPGATSGTSNVDTASFNGAPANRTITVDAGRNIEFLSFGATASNFTVGSTSGNLLTLTNGGNATFASNAGSNITQAINAPLALAGAYTVTNNNTLASGNVISVGGSVTSLSGTSSAFTIGGSGAVTLSGNLSNGVGGGSMTLTKNAASAGTLNITGGVSSYSRISIGGTSGLVTYSGGTTALLIPNQNYISVGVSSTLAITGGEIDIATAGGNAFGGSGTILQTGGTMALSGSATLANVSFAGVIANYTINGGSFTMTGTTTTVRGIGNFTAGGTASVLIDALGNGSGPKIADSDLSSLTVGGGASVTFTSTLGVVVASTGTGTVNLNGGTLNVVKFATAGVGQSTINFNSGTLQFASSGSLSASQVKNLNVLDGGAVIDTGSNAINATQAFLASGTGGLTKIGSGTLTLSATNTYTGATTINAGVLKTAVATNALGSNSAVVLANTAGATLDTTNLSQTIGSLAGGGTTGGNVLLGTGTLTVGGNNTSTTYSGTISGSGGLVKTGNGTFTLTGTQGYTGSTVVNVGSLVVNGRLGNGGITVASGAKLGGNITAGGVTTISSGGTLAVGNSPGTGNFATLNLSGSSAVSVTEMQFNAGASPGNAGTDFDTINVSTALTYGGTLKLVFSGSVGSGTFDLFNFGVLTPSNDFGSVALYANTGLIGSLSEAGGVWTGIFDLGLGSGTQSFTFTNSTGDLAIAVPEPGTWVLVGLGLGLVIMRCRRQTNRE